MPFLNSSGLRFFIFENLSIEGIVHAVFTRKGGISREPWASLNLGGTVGDDPQRVEANRRSVFRTINRPFESSFDVWQVHSSKVVRAESPLSPGEPHVQADAILTNNPGVTLFMRFADCVPILLFDPIHQAIGLVHSGWQGTVEKIISIAVKEMENQFQTSPADLLAGIGPSIGSDHYFVGEDVIARVKNSFGENADQVLLFEGSEEGKSKVKFDLWMANKLLLEQCGVKNIEVSKICTACHLDDWYSHRAEKGRTGRFGVLIGLQRA